MNELKGPAASMAAGPGKVWSMFEFDVVVIGGGSAGMAAALAARKNGARKVAIIERDFRLGGILEQCIHTGFGLKRFGEELSGPEYVTRFTDEILRTDIQVFLNTTVLVIRAGSRTIETVSKGRTDIFRAGAIVLAMGCRERTRFQISIPGSRPAGVFTAGSAQRFINIQNYRVGNRVVILGSGDIGMIMARRMTLEGAKVEAVVEIMPFLAGLTRNRVQCLDDFGIPLYLGHTITKIHGNERVTGVTVMKMDGERRPILGTEFEVECDTVLCSVGLIPENELSVKAGLTIDRTTLGVVVDSSMQTNCPGIFACGNVVHVNDLVDNVSEEGDRAGGFAAAYAAGNMETDDRIDLHPQQQVRYLVPQMLRKTGMEKSIKIFFRVKQPQRNAVIQVKTIDKVLWQRKKEYVNPGEMECVELDAAMLRDAGAADIFVSCTEEER